MKKKDTRILRKRKRNLAKRLERKQWPEQDRPVFRARNIHYEMAERTRAIDCGGIGGLHALAEGVGLIGAIDESLRLLKRHLPYHESDHALNIAYNILTGGTCLDDIELRRNDESYMDALGADRIPDPTTAGDFTRRFSHKDIFALMESANRIRLKIRRKRLRRKERKLAIIDADGMVAPTTGECKEWLDRAASLAGQVFDRVCFRGDTDFALTKAFDRWTWEGKEFVFGTDARPNLVKLAEGLEESDWRELKRREKKRITGEKRERPANVKERIVVERGYKNITLESEHVAEFSCQPGKCRRPYRMIVLRKTLRIEKGRKLLFPETRYFFCVTNREDLTTAEVVFFANERCDQENLIDQLKNGLNALRMPAGDLASNWAYMVMASLAWTLKAWFALLVREREKRTGLLRMEFRRFLNAIVRVPCQIVRGGRRIVYRILGYNEWTGVFLRTFDVIRSLRFTQVKDGRLEMGKRGDSMSGTRCFSSSSRKPHRVACIAAHLGSAPFLFSASLSPRRPAAMFRRGIRLIWG